MSWCLSSISCEARHEVDRRPPRLARPTDGYRGACPSRHARRVMKSVDVLGVRVDDVTYAEALALLRRALESRVPHVVTTPNPEIVLLARGDTSFRSVLNRAALNIPDGIGLVLAARLAGDRLREHVQGTD